MRTGTSTKRASTSGTTPSDTLMGQHRRSASRPRRPPHHAFDGSSSSCRALAEASWAADEEEPHPLHFGNPARGRLRQQNADSSSRRLPTAREWLLARQLQLDDLQLRNTPEGSRSDAQPLHRRAIARCTRPTPTTTFASDQRPPARSFAKPCWNSPTRTRHGPVRLRPRPRR